MINEILYTCKSDEALRRLKVDSQLDLAAKYHEGYEEQMLKWPEHPLDRIVKHVNNLNLKPASVVLDLGAGACRLSSSLTNKKVSVISVDFAPPPRVILPPERTSAETYLKQGGLIKSSIRHVSILPDNCANVAVFCLSLMGTDWPFFLAEAFRLLKSGGTLVIAEVYTRARRPAKLLKHLENQSLKLYKKEEVGNYFFIWYFRVNKKDRKEVEAVPDQLHKAKNSKQQQTTTNFDANEIPSHLLTPCVYKKLKQKMPRPENSGSKRSKEQPSREGKGRAVQKIVGKKKT